MPATFTPLGPGTVTIGTTPLDFSAEVTGAKITHDYEDVGEAFTTLDGTNYPATRQKADGFTATLVNDLTAAGLYAYLQLHDLETVDFEFTPNTGAGGSWAGQVTLTLPAEIGADDFGANMASEVDWSAVGALVFTAAT